MYKVKIIFTNLCYFFLPTIVKFKNKKMKQNKFILALIVLLINNLNVTFGQTGKSDTLSFIISDDIIITGTQSEISAKYNPLTISIISEKTLKESTKSNILPIVAQHIPGMFVSSKNMMGFGAGTKGAGKISFRGIGASNDANTDVLILIDGQPQFMGIFGHPLADMYIAQEAERVEVLRGPASVLYGTGAMGGVMNIITKKNREEGFSGSAQIMGGSFGSQVAGGAINFNNGKLNIYVSANTNSTTGHRDSSGFSGTNFYTKASYPFSKKIKMNIDLAYAKISSDDPGIVEQPKLTNIKLKRGRAGLAVENKFENIEGALKATYNFGIHDITDGWHSNDQNSTIQFYQTGRFFENNLITIGAEYQNYGGKGNQGASKDRFKSTANRAIYTFCQQNILKTLNLTAGLRLENNQLWGNELIPHFGASWNFETSTLKASYSKGFRSPTIMELYFFLPNADLKQQKVNSWEISFLQNLFKNKLKVEATTFFAKGSNMIETLAMKRTNTGKFTHKGVELAANLKIDKNLNFYTNYSYLNMNTPKPISPEQLLNLGGDFTYKKLNISASMQHVQNLYLDVVTKEKTSFTTLNLKINLHLSDILDTFVSVDNLTDTKYQLVKGYPMPGTNLMVGVKVNM
jgi:outer membrane cobalamin receptor